MSRLQEHINRQISSNSRKNIFYAGTTGGLSFTEATLSLLNGGTALYRDEIEKKNILKYTVEKVKEQLLEINQYYSINEEAESKLYTIYLHLLDELEKVRDCADHDQLKRIAGDHHHSLKQWLLSFNSFAEKIYGAESPGISENVHCSEYSAAFQLEVLGINTNELMEPVLDVGCGRLHTLVTHLRDLNIQAYGLERISSTHDHIISADWMDYRFEPVQWGTIISNMAFSNHFIHHHLREDGNFTSYARKYMEILNALKPGGSFYYAPSLPFIEALLDKKIFTVSHRSIMNSALKTTCITRCV